MVNAEHQAEAGRYDSLEIKNIVRGLKFKDEELFVFDGLENNIFLFDEEHSNGKTIRFCRSNELSGYDFHILKSLPTKEKEQLLFSGILEAYLSRYIGAPAAQEVARSEAEKAYGKHQ